MNNSVLCWIGDSISEGDGYLSGANNILYGPGGLYEGWTVFNSSMNGSYLRDWVLSIASGDPDAEPLDEADYDKNVWRVRNADPDRVNLMLGTNDVRKWNDGTPGYTDIAAAEAGMMTDMTTLVGWLLANTMALISLQVPPTLTFIAGSTTDFCDFVDADDAADRSAMIRRVYRSFRGHSPRVTVLDLPRAMFPARTPDAALRWDSLAASVDPDRAGEIIKVDELHLTGWGECLRAYAICREADPSLPASTEFQRPWVALHQGLALMSTRAVIKGVGSDYIDIYSDSGQHIFGDTEPASTNRGPLSNLAIISQLSAAGLQSALNYILRSRRFRIFDSAGCNTLVEPLSIEHNLNGGGVGDYFRITVDGSPTTAPGLADIYIDDEAGLPPTPTPYEAVTVNIFGDAGQGCASFSTSGRKIPISMTTIQAVRQAAPDECQIDVYVRDTWNGAHSAGGTSKGYRLGKITLPENHLLASAWTPDPTNFPTGNAELPENPDYKTALYCEVVSGSKGDWATVTLKSS